MLMFMAERMTRARANSTSEARERWRARIKDPDYNPPRYEPKPDKPVGSKRLTSAGWVIVKPGDKDAEEQ